MHALKPTRWASSSHWMIRGLSRRCSKDHLHQPLLDGRAKAAEHYPMELVVEILRGIRDTADGKHNDYDDDDMPKEQLLCANVGFMGGDNVPST